MSGRKHKIPADATCHYCGVEAGLERININGEIIYTCRPCCPSLYYCPACDTHHNTAPIELIPKSERRSRWHYGVWNDDESFYSRHIYADNISKVFDQSIISDHGFLCVTCIEYLIDNGEARQSKKCEICGGDSFGHEESNYHQNVHGLKHVCNTCVRRKRWCVVCKQWEDINKIAHEPIRNADGEGRRRLRLSNTDIACHRGLDRQGLFMCRHCGGIHSKADRHKGLGVCKECSKYYRECPDCGRESLLNQETGACPECTARYYKKCTSCGKRKRTLHVNNQRGVNVCYDCYWGNPVLAVGAYNTRVAPIFHGTSPDNLFFGLELELDFNKCRPRDQGYVAGQMHLAKSAKDHMVVVHDGSIGRGGGMGYEVVTMPMTFEYMKEWDVAKKCIPPNIRKHSPSAGCGVHIHMSKETFTNMQLFRFLEFIYANEAYVTAIARRAPDSRYCQKYDNVDNYRLAMQKTGTDKYVQVNLANSATVELRMFKGTHSGEVLWQYIEFAKALFEYTKDDKLTKEDMQDVKRFAKYVKDNKKEYPHLASRHAKIKQAGIIN